MIKLLISITAADETRAVFEGAADIVDVKNPAEGALGAASTEVLSEVRRLLPADCPTSAALGETDSAEGTLALAAYGAAALGARYVKVGLRLGESQKAVSLLRSMGASAQRANPDCGLIAVGYADAEYIGAIPWQHLPEIARAAQVEGCMIDTAIKNRQGLFNHCQESALKQWVAECRQARLLCALAGSLNRDDLPAVRRLRPDIVGFRSAACRGDRINGRIDPELVAALGAGLKG
jgi:uncharacterized protein (UPF0264 family)